MSESQRAISNIQFIFKSDTVFVGFKFRVIHRLTKQFYNEQTDAESVGLNRNSTRPIRSLGSNSSSYPPQQGRVVLLDLINYPDRFFLHDPTHHHCNLILLLEAL